MQDDELLHFIEKGYEAQNGYVPKPCWKGDWD